MVPLTPAAAHREAVLFRDDGCSVAHNCDPADPLDAAHHPISKQTITRKREAALTAMAAGKELSPGRRHLAQTPLEDVLYDPRNSIGLCRALHHRLDNGTLDLPIPDDAEAFCEEYDL